MHCPWCHNAYLIPYPFGTNTTHIEPTDFFAFLAQRKNLLDGVVITGGEPTLQPDLTDFCANVKEMGFSIKLDTNGTMPERIEQLVENDLVDYLAMDIKTDLEHYPKLFREGIDAKAIVESARLVFLSKKPYEFRTTCVAPYVSPKNIAAIGQLIEGAKRHYLQKCNDPDPQTQHSAYEIMNEAAMRPLQREMKKYVARCEMR